MTADGRGCASCFDAFWKVFLREECVGNCYYLAGLRTCCADRMST